jgi:hypothetical protein
MSFGVSSSSSRAFEYDAVFADADRALYCAKAAGGNSVQVALADEPIAVAGARDQIPALAGA